MSKKLKTAALLLLLIMVITAFPSCKNDEGKAPVGSVITDPEDNYDYHSLDLGGADFNILNFENLWEMYIHVTTDTQGTQLDQAVWKRNIEIQDRYNCNIKEVKLKYSGYDTGFIDIAQKAVNSISSGLDEYDAMYMTVSQYPELITGGYIQDLGTINSLHLESEWWDTRLIDEVSLYGHKYIATGALNLMPYEAMVCVFFNKTMANDNGIENMYDLVRNNEWTIEKMLTISKGIVSLNGDETFDWNAKGNATYGMAIHRDFPTKFLRGSGITYVSDAKGDGLLSFNIENLDKFNDICSKVADLFNVTNGNAVGTTGASDSNYYCNVFKSERSLFLSAELKSATVFRSSQDLDFGILPIPTYDTNQTQYYTDCTARLMYLCIPTSNKQTEQTGIVLDAITYRSYNNVVPVYYDSYVAAKGLRDEDSYEMLEKISSARGIDIGETYGWASEFLMAMNKKLYIGDSAVNSLINTYKPNINSNIEDFMNKMG